MTRRPSFIRCAACGEDKPSKGAREAQVAWCRPFDGEGSHTDPQELQRLQIYVCAPCWRARHVFGEGEVPETAEEARARARAALEERPSQEAMFR